MTQVSDVADVVPPVVDISRLKKKRSANRNVVRGLITKAKALISEEYNEGNRKQIQATLQVILAKEKGIRETDEDIQDAIDESMLSADIEEAAKFDLDVGIEKIGIEEYLSLTKGES